MHFYFLRNDQTDLALSHFNSIQRDSPILIWLGEKPHLGHFPNRIISLANLLEIRSKKLHVNWNELETILPAKPVTKADDLELDEDIVLSKQKDGVYLLLVKSGSTYQHKVRIRPQAYNIVRFFYDMRHRKPSAFKLEELVERGFAKNKRTITARIKETNELCVRYQVKAIAYKFMGHEWGLNRELGCCR